MGHAIDTFKSAWRSRDLRKKLLFTFVMLLLYRIGGNIPVPGIDRVAFSNLLDRFGQLGTMMNIISGGGLRSVSIFAMGILPYINSSIIIQLLTVAIPYLQNLSKEGEVGRKKIQAIVRYLTIGLGLIQAVAFWYATKSASSEVLPPVLNALVVIFSFTAGTAVIMWIGEQINEWGIGNGISLIIFVGILSGMGSLVSGLGAYIGIWTERFSFYVAVLFAVALVAIAILLIIFVTYVSLAERKIPVTYGKRVVGRKQYAGQNSYLPIKVNQSGVMPVIFATSLMTLPNMLITFFFSNVDNVVVNWFRNPGSSPLYYFVQALLIIGFTFFYSAISFNTIEIANNLQKNGGYIPGIRPGKPTIEYLGKVTMRLCWLDGIFLCVLTLLPLLIGSLTNTSALWFGGTSLLIMVGVAVDFMNRLESNLMHSQYRGFLD